MGKTDTMQRSPLEMIESGEGFTMWLTDDGGLMVLRDDGSGAFYPPMQRQRFFAWLRRLLGGRRRGA